MNILGYEFFCGYFLGSLQTWTVYGIQLNYNQLFLGVLRSMYRMRIFFLSIFFFFWGGGAGWGGG